MDDEIIDELVGNEAASQEASEDSSAAAAETGEAGAADKTVPIEALHEAREQNRELRGELESFKNKDMRLEEIQHRLDQMATPATEAETPLPEFEADPKGYIDAQFQKLAQAQEQTSAKADETAETTQQASAMQQLTTAITTDHQAFMAKTPEYVDALNYARSIKLQELQEAGFSEIDAQRAIRTEEMQMSAVALQNGKSPAEVAFKRAKLWGFKAEAVTDEGKAAEDEPKPDLEEAASMGSGNVPSVQDMLEADSDEFDAMFSDLGYGKKMV